jgi:hypothetical protein
MVKMTEVKIWQKLKANIKDCCSSVIRRFMAAAIAYEKGIDAGRGVTLLLLRRTHVNPGLV